MNYKPHPVLTGLRKLCSGNLPLYEAMIALMKEEILKDSNSVRKFTRALKQENEMIYTAEQTYQILISQKNANKPLLDAIFRQANS